MINHELYFSGLGWQDKEEPFSQFRFRIFVESEKPYGCSFDGASYLIDSWKAKKSESDNSLRPRNLL